MKPSQWLFHQITDKDYVYSPESGIRGQERDDESDRRFIKRFDGHLSFAGKQVLDVGCGMGSLCGEIARQNAKRVTGVDLDIEPARARVREHYADVADRIELVRTAGQLEELSGRRFDLVNSKDSMEHFPDPESFIHLLTQLVRPGGELAIGFSPLWKSPQGGHIEYMTRLPWAHLLFSEQTIMAERRRFRPNEDAGSFAEIKGGLNKMTFRRYCDIMADTGFEPLYFETNVSDHPAVKAMKAIARIRPLREYFTQSVYSIWRRPDEQARPVGAQN
jgi:SAM-dependent methyltransferase